MSMKIQNFKEILIHQRINMVLSIKGGNLLTFRKS